jgi:hypothetical protein
VVDGIFDRHFRCEDLLEEARHLKVAVTVVSVQQIEVAWVLRRLNQSLVSHKNFRAIGPLLVAPTCPESFQKVMSPTG